MLALLIASFILCQVHKHIQISCHQVAQILAYTNKTLGSNAEINWASDLVPGKQIFAVSRTAMRTQRMKADRAGRSDNEG